MRATIVGDGPLCGHRAAELRQFADTRVIDAETWNEVSEQDTGHTAGDVVVVEDAGHRTIEFARRALKAGCHTLVNLPRAQSITEARRLAPLAEEAGVLLGASAVFRALPSIRSLARPRARLVSINASVTQDEEFLFRLVDWIDACLAVIDSRDVQKLDAECVRRPSGAVAALGVSIRFQNGTLALLHLDRGDNNASISVGGESSHERINMTRHGITEEIGPAVRFETRAFVDSVLKKQRAPVSIAAALQSLQLTEYIMRRLRRRAIVTI